MLDESCHYKTNGELMRWETKMKQTIEKKHSRIGVNPTMIDI